MLIDALYVPHGAAVAQEQERAGVGDQRKGSRGRGQRAQAAGIGTGERVVGQPALRAATGSIGASFP
jgi:hypothetical protein